MVYCSLWCAVMKFDNFDNVSPAILKKTLDVKCCVLKCLSIVVKHGQIEAKKKSFIYITEDAFNGADRERHG